MYFSSRGKKEHSNEAINLHCKKIKNNRNIDKKSKDKGRKLSKRKVTEEYIKLNNGNVKNSLSKSLRKKRASSRYSNVSHLQREDRGTSMILMELSPYSKSPSKHPNFVADQISQMRILRNKLREKNHFKQIEKFKRNKRYNEARIDKMRNRMLFKNRSKMLNNKLKDEMAKLAIEKYKSQHRGHKWGLCNCKQISDVPISR